MKRFSLPVVAGRAAPLASAMALAVLMAGTAVQPAGAACQDVDGMTANFLTVYPTGGHAARFDGERGDQVMRSLAIGREADEVIFLYSGDGPVTGARGRYLYLLLDPADCVLDSDWIDGETFDRVVPAQ